MKDKEKQIEEMAKDIAKRDCHLYDTCPKEPKHNCVSQDPKIMLESSKNYITIATWLVNANYQKLYKDSVVLSKEEFWKLSNKFSKKELDEIVEFHKNKARKETAEKIYKEGKELFGEDFDKTGLGEYIMANFLSQNNSVLR